MEKMKKKIALSYTNETKYMITILNNKIIWYEIMWNKSYKTELYDMKCNWNELI